MDNKIALYPLKFEPIFQYRLWGGRKLEEATGRLLPQEGPYGEAWILSDRDDFTSSVSQGPLMGKTVQELIHFDPVGMLGPLAGKYRRLPLLLKFLDAKEMLSVQVHPSDAHKELLPHGERGKTEAWVVLEAEPESRIYAGLKPGTSASDLRHITSANADDFLASFSPKEGDGVFIEAGTVHALGGGVLVFEVQQNSDVTFRMFDWDRIDAKTGKSRELHIEDAIKCIDFEKGPLGPVVAQMIQSEPVEIEKLFESEFFLLWRIRGRQPFEVGFLNEMRILVCTSGKGSLEWNSEGISIRKGDVFLIPAQVGVCKCAPESDLELLQIQIP